MSDQVQPSTPGAGAHAEYERRRRSRLKRDPGSAAPAHETSWLIGARGEALLGERLNDDARLVGGVAILHDVALPGKRANIDHLVIGPAGVTVIDAKAWTGDLWVGRKVIGRGRRGRRAPIDGMQRQVNRVCTVLATHGRDDVPVEGALCFVNNNHGVDGSDCKRIDAIIVGTTAAVSRHAMRLGRYSLAEVLDLMEILRAAFVVSGGRCLPTQPRIAPVTTPRWSRLPRQGRARRRLTYRQRRALRRGFLATVRVALGLALAGVALSVAAALLGGVARTATTLTRTEVLAQGATYRAVAEQRAHGTVRGPRIRETAAAFTFVYRRGRHCHVAVTVDRARLANALAAPSVMSTSCRRHA